MFRMLPTQAFSTSRQQQAFFASVLSYLPCQAAGVGRSYSTHLTTKYFFHNVYSHMHGQAASNGKLFITHLATIGDFP